MLNLILSKISRSPNKCIDCDAEQPGGVLGAAADMFQLTYLSDWSSERHLWGW